MRQAPLALGDDEEVAEGVDPADEDLRPVRDQLLPRRGEGSSTGAVTTRKFFASLFVRM